MLVLISGWSPAFSSAAQAGRDWGCNEHLFGAVLTTQPSLAVESVGFCKNLVSLVGPDTSYQNIKPDFNLPSLPQEEASLSVLGCLETERRDMPSLPASIIVFPFCYIKKARALVSHLAFLALIKNSQCNCSL